MGTAVRAELTSFGVAIRFDDGTTYMLANERLTAACIKYGELVYDESDEVLQNDAADERAA